MKLQTQTITQLTITEVPGLDPVRVMLENYEPGKGRITIQCWDGAWSAYWGGMAGRTVQQFFVDEDNAYLMGYLAPALRSGKFSAGKLQQLVRTVILQRRRGRYADAAWLMDRLDGEAARDLWDRVDELWEVEGERDCWGHSDLLTAIFGEEWWYGVAGRAEEMHPQWDWLQRICDAVREGLRQYMAQQSEVAHAQ